MSLLRALTRDPAEATPAQRRAIVALAWLPVMLLWGWLAVVAIEAVPISIAGGSVALSARALWRMESQSVWGWLTVTSAALLVWSVVR